MTTPIACSSCANWRQLRPQDNWGDCNEIAEGYRTSDMACIRRNPPSNTTLPPAQQIVLSTRDVFYCAAYKRKEVHQYSIVDAAREAAKTFNSKRKE